MFPRRPRRKLSFVAVGPSVVPGSSYRGNVIRAQTKGSSAVKTSARNNLTSDRQAMFCLLGARFPVPHNQKQLVHLPRCNAPSLQDLISAPWQVVFQIVPQNGVGLEPTMFRSNECFNEGGSSTRTHPACELRNDAPKPGSSPVGALQRNESVTARCLCTADGFLDPFPCFL